MSAFLVLVLTSLAVVSLGLGTYALPPQRVLEAPIYLDANPAGEARGVPVATGAIVVMLWIGSTRYLDVAARALVGGAVTAMIVYLLAIKRGSVGGFRLIVMKDGGIVTARPPGAVITAELIDEVYELPCRVVPDPETGAPMVIPMARLR
ncbi:hypothetical protein [Leucobacter celer]|uniref:hypothetical protein n=1 Tax=Leucobacter celer TaxID=668625 RepID=UPI0006A75FB8|nr:hypothetical protein [Leucobacter celer]